MPQFNQQGHHPMKIREIRYWKEDLELTRPYTITYVVHDHIDNLFVQVICDDGLYGLGSGSPSQYVTGELFDEDFSSRTDTLSSILVGRDIREFRALIADLGAALPKNPALLAALDMALYDAFCKYIDIPILRFLGQKVKPLPTSVTIGIQSIDATLEDAREFKSKGFKILKLKIGQSPELDLERFIKLRECVGREMKIRVDANQGFTKDQLLHFIDQAEPYELEFFEQPFKPGQLDAMRQLPRSVRDLSAADEDLHKMNDALDIAQAPSAYGIFNIKLMKCGGITEALRIAAVSECNGIELMWGCMDESCISISAGLNAALSCPQTRYLDLDGNFDLARDVATGGFILKEGILYPVLDKPGLGVELIA